MNPVIVLCSRPESRRLPGKVFKRICGMTVLDLIMSRVASLPWKKILAIDTEVNAPRYRGYTEHYGWDLFVGQPDSPLHRTAEAVRRFAPEAEYVCRITHDDVLIDAKTASDLADAVRQANAGYGCPPPIIEGAGVEIISTRNLSEAAARNGDTEFLSYFVRGPGMPLAGSIAMQPRPEICRPYRLTMDYPEDALVLETVLRETGRLASVDDICAFLDRHSYILNFNHVPDVSVYTCVRNGAEWIGEAMQSVLASTEDLEYIIIDDCSTDGTLREIAKCCQDQRVKVFVNDANMGLASSSNRAVAEARGKWVMRVDADDVLLSGAIRRMREVGESTGSVLVYSAFRELSEELSGVKDPRGRHHAGCALMSKRFLNELRFKDGLRLGDSAELFKRASEKGARISYIIEPLWLYRQTEGSLTRGT